MKAIILAGGRGKRLGELTAERPKPLVEVSGKPILEHLIMNASQAGIDDFIVNVGYLGGKISDYFGNGSRLGVHMSYYLTSNKGPEAPILETGSDIEDDRFCCLCGDNILSAAQIKDMIRYHESHDADATFMLENGEPITKKRVKVVDERIISSSMLPYDPVLVYNMVIQASFFKVLSKAVAGKAEPAFAFAMDDIADMHRIYALDIPFININHPEDVDKAEKIMRNGEYDRQK